MSYSIENSKRESAEVKKLFAELFPLAGERDLPTALCHIPEFLKRRMEFEVEQRVHWFQSRVVKVLCEQSPPKQHVDDMCRIVVNKVKDLQDCNKRVGIMLEVDREKHRALIQAAADLLAVADDVFGPDHPGDMRIAKLRDAVDSSRRLF